jgi:hypothetical protein
VVTNLFPDLRKTQAVNLGLAVYGQIISQSTVLSQIVREVPGAVKHKHRLKRLWRFVSNSRIKPDRLFDTWIPWVIKRFTTSGYVPVALDWTGLPGNLMCLTASLVLSGRAIPLLWQVIRYSQIKDSTNRIEQRLVTRLINLVPSGKKLVLTADRGFGRTELLKFLLTKNILFAIRVDKNVRVKPEHKRPFLLSTLAKKLIPEIPVWFSAVSYRDDGAIPQISLTAVVAKCSDDPWFLATNLKSPFKAISAYTTRFQIEEGFKDMKHALGFEKIQTKNLVRVRRLILITTVSQAILILIGRLAFRMTKLKSTLISGGKQACSRIWLAIQIVKRKLLGQPFWARVRQVALGP